MVIVRWTDHRDVQQDDSLTFEQKKKERERDKMSVKKNNN
jgi:hypothetical protein